MITSDSEAAPEAGIAQQALPPRARRPRRRARAMLAALSAAGLAALAWASFAHPDPRLIYNPSDSVPVGWYRVDPMASAASRSPTRVSVGSIVLVRLPAGVAALASQRGYLPAHIPLLKRVGAVAPQHVCIVAGHVLIDGMPVARTLTVDRMGRALLSWPECRQLARGELFLLSETNPASFDSRYFGPVSASAVVGVARPVWLETHP
ncbi:S26 family signal peptidase [Acidovorax sp. NCPPB 3859]|nr:S26 family signal peptidase [Acidovorax sp. NCPPB 3859]WCM85478.1 S26 family signal peptidase [Acidovorax sp. NCPPB 3859]